MLSRWLDYLKPEVITLEFSQYGMMFRRMHRAKLRAKLDLLVEKMGLDQGEIKKGALEVLYDYIDLPYEYTEALGYAERFKIPFHLLDLDLFSYLNLQRIDELLDEKNVRCWLSEHEEAEQEAGKQRALARLFFDKGLRTFSHTDEMIVRDRHLKERLAFLISRCQEKRVLHVCGWQHLSDPYNIFDALNPRKVFAYDRSICI